MANALFPVYVTVGDAIAGKHYIHYTKCATVRDLVTEIVTNTRAWKTGQPTPNAYQLRGPLISGDAPVERGMVFQLAAASPRQIPVTAEEIAASTAAGTSKHLNRYFHPHELTFHPNNPRYASEHERHWCERCSQHVRPTGYRCDQCMFDCCVACWIDVPVEQPQEPEAKQPVNAGAAVAQPRVFSKSRPMRAARPRRAEANTAAATTSYPNTSTVKQENAQ